MEDRADTNNSKNYLYFLQFFCLYVRGIGFFLFFQILPSWIRLRIHMDIFGIPDPHKNLCGSETLIMTTTANFGGLINCIFLKIQVEALQCCGSGAALFSWSHDKSGGSGLTSSSTPDLRLKQYYGA